MIFPNQYVWMTSRYLVVTIYCLQSTERNDDPKLSRMKEKLNPLMRLVAAVRSHHHLITGYLQAANNVQNILL